MAGEVDKRQRKAPTQMLEVLQKTHPDVIALPGFSEISSFVGSLIQRAKKKKEEGGVMDMPQARAPPTPQAVADAIEGLDVAWSSEVVGAKPSGEPALGHRVGAKKFIVQDLYDEMKLQYTRGGLVSEDFPGPSRFKSLIAKQRKARKDLAARGGGVAAPNLLRK